MTAKIFYKFIEIFYWRLERARVQKNAAQCMYLGECGVVEGD